ncbi:MULTISPECIES: DUF4189 domain-containing protein [unclassified Rhizobium]|jgi:hypothetical protein|uniref:DUF4189 domain-containing protein n=1 Tax=unclassified Rhizobium TaxID=2613769 RepID=UPI0009DCBB72|nr:MULTISPECIES: DUF4189 domain-containing protein [unclassified Rhizobium]
MSAHSRVIFSFVALAMFGVMGLWGSGSKAYAEGGTCPPGYYPMGGGCAPLPPGYYGNQPGPGSDGKSGLAPEYHPTTYGAIAMTLPRGFWGSRMHTSTQAAADKQALAACAAKGAPGCRIVARVKDGCVAIASGFAKDPGKAVTSNGKLITIKVGLFEAEQAAMQACQMSATGCQLHAVLCTDGNP